MEGAGFMGNPVICSPGIKHTEAIVVLGGKQEITETAFLSQTCPAVGTEFNGIESLICIDILLFEGGNVGPVHIFLGPAAVPV